MLQHFQHGRHELHLLAGLAADPFPLRAAVGASLLRGGEIVFDSFAGQMAGQSLVSITLTTMFADHNRGVFRCVGRWRIAVRRLCVRGIEQL